SNRLKAGLQTNDPIIAVTRNGREDSGAEISFDTNGKLELLASIQGNYELKSASGRILKAQIKTLPNPIELTGKWDVHFPPNSGAPEQVTFNKLLSWSQHTMPGVKYFSGTAT